MSRSERHGFSWCEVEEEMDPNRAGAGPGPSPGPNLKTTAAAAAAAKIRKMERPPTPQELVSYYESRGLDNAQASLKVIEDLQNLLLRSISSSRAKDKLPAAGGTLRKIDSAADRLAVLELKLDSKPGYAQVFAVAVAAEATVRVLPHVVRALGEAWSTVAGGIRGNNH